MKNYKFQHVVGREGYFLRLYERQSRLIGHAKEMPVPVERWFESEILGGKSVAGRLGRLMREGETKEQDGGLLLPHRTISELSRGQARTLGLPPDVTLVLNLQIEGSFTDRNAGKIRASWFQPGRSVNTSRKGAELSLGNQRFRIPKLLFEIVEAVDRYNGLGDVPFDKRIAAFAELRASLPEEAAEQIVLGDGIRNVRIHHAAAFSLDVRSDQQGNIVFDPVLFGERAVHEAFEAGVQLSEARALLPQAMQNRFVERFTQTDGGKSAFVVGLRSYVFVEPVLRRALKVVRQMQDSSAEERWDFIRSPQRHIQEAFVDSGGALDDETLIEMDAAIEGLFVETEQFSERIVAIGIWQPPVLPWLQHAPQDWMPETFGLQIGEVYLPLGPREVTELREVIENAKAEGRHSVVYNGVTVPVSEKTIQSLQRLIGLTQPPADPTGDPPEPTGPSLPESDLGRLALLVRQNFDQLEFDLRDCQPRREAIDRTIPPIVIPPLMRHQGVGISWLQDCWQRGYPGCLLADDMGIGKTLQALVFLVWLKEVLVRDGDTRPILVVAPTGLLKNWEAEHDRHLIAPGLGPLVRAYGTDLRKMKHGTGRTASLDKRSITDAGWVLTTYETLRDNQIAFGAIRFACVVMDEMQKVKAPRSENHHAVKTLNAEFLVGMTGTPVENGLSDLWAIMDVLYPGLLGDLKGFLDAYPTEDMGAMERLRKKLLDGKIGQPAPVLRRHKDDVLDGLPKKHLRSYRETMPPMQAEAYAQAISSAKSSDAKGWMLQLLHRMRGISLHPEEPSGVPELDTDYVERSARLRRCFQILDEIVSADEKVLIFLENLAMQDALSELIKQRYGLPRLPEQINGEMRPALRQRVVDDFQQRSGFDALIISPRAGGVGLTITAANHVIHLSRWWNPAVEDQCTDRAYRIGQEKDVHVYHPIALHPNLGDTSFDVILDDLLRQKRRTAGRLLVPPVDAAADQAYFAERMAGLLDDDADLLAEIDHFGPLRFETWVIKQMQQAGWSADATPATGDGGADAILRRDDRIMIVQCKHREDHTKSTSADAIDDLVRAREVYRMPDAELVAVTNAGRFTEGARRRAVGIGVTLCARRDLSSLADILDRMET